VIPCSTTPPTPDNRRLRALRLTGARLDGVLDLEAAVLECDLVLTDCCFDAPINLRDAQASAIRLPGCHLPGITANGLRVRSNLNLRSVVTTHGEVRLIGAHIGGQLSLDGASLTNPNGTALQTDSLTVDQSMFCRNGFTAQGEVRMIGAHIGNLEFDGASLTNPDGSVLTADNLTVDQSMFCRNGFTAQGEVRLVGARIGGVLDLTGASLTNPKGPALQGDGLTVDLGMFCQDGFTAQGEVRLIGAHVGGQLSLTGASLTNPKGLALQADSLRVDQSMFCRNGFTAQGEVCLIGAHIGGQLSLSDASLTNPNGLALHLERATTGALTLLLRKRPEGVVDLTNARVGSLRDDPASWPDKMRLRGFVYETLENDSVGVRARLDWLARHQEGYAPGLFDQLAAMYRRTGHVEEARRVAIAKQQRRRREFKPLGKVWNWLLYVTVGYGYRPWLAGLWLAGLLAVGAAIFTGAHPSQIHPVSASAPKFQPVVYTLDVLLPVVDFGQEKAWVAQDTARTWAWVLTGAGWVLTTAFLAGLTNALKRD
jgi:hypothetical protein